MLMQRLNDLINNPELMGDETLEELKSLISRYPYFQTAWLLYLKNLYLLKSPSFKEELRRGALYVADLSVLFYFIEGEKYSLDCIKGDSSEVVQTNDRTLDIINRFLSEIPNDKGFNPDLSIQPETVPDYSSLLLLNSSDEKNNDDSISSSPLRGQELIDSFIEKSESGQFLNEKNGKFEDTEKVDEIGDDADFYAADTEDEETSIQADNKTLDGGEDEYLTETLAKIYVKQQRYDKALEIIKKLNLKYPKKNIYFADQIRYLERLIINAKSK